MKFNRVKNAKRNSIWGMVSKVVTMICPFIIRTIMIKTLGMEYLGLNSLFSAILNILNCTELGFGLAIVYSMYKPVAENNYKLIHALLNMYKKIYRTIGFIVLCIGICLLPFLRQLIHGDIPSSINIYILFIIYLMNSVSSYWFFAYKLAILKVNQRADIISKISLIAITLMYFLQIIALIIFKNYYLYIILLPLSTIFNNTIAAVYVKKKFPQFIADGEVEQETKNELKTKVMGLMIIKISSISRNAFDSIVISTYLGLKEVAIYNNYYYILNSITGFLAVFTTAISGIAGNTVVTETTEKNYSDMNRLNFAYMWISGWCTVCLACLYQPFMKLWVGENAMFSNEIMWLFPIYFIIIKLGDVMAQYFDATGLWNQRKWYALGEAVGNLLLNFLLGYLFGVVGILVATIITTIFLDFIVSSRVIFKHYFKNGYFKYIISQTKYMLISLMVAIFTYIICVLLDNAITNTMLQFILKILICIIIPNVMFFVIYKNTCIYKETYKWLVKRTENNKK